VNLVFKYQDATQEVVDFLYRVGYPHTGWDVEKMQQLTFISRMQTLDKTLVGYVWYSWVPDTHRILELHVAVEKKFHGQWLDRTVSKQICSLANFIDSRLLLIFWRDKKPLVKLRRLGWQVKPPFAWMEI